MRQGRVQWPVSGGAEFRGVAQPSLGQQLQVTFKLKHKLSALDESKKTKKSVAISAQRDLHTK